MVGAPLTTAPNISDMIEREGEGEETEFDRCVLLFIPAPQVIERKGINNMRCIFAPLFAAGSQNIIGIFASGIGAYSATKCGSIAEICPAGLSSIIGMNEPVISAHTTNNNNFFDILLHLPAIANNNCFEKKEKKDLCSLLQYSSGIEKCSLYCSSLHVTMVFVVCCLCIWQTTNYLHKMQMTKQKRLKKLL